ncbi:MAG: hypothetical protein SF028_14640 [Candidatus Sumerlaeia bacterium]|nr:hypothetical protein [Candidatus Sumerlaeia bacterium]
MSPEYIVTAGHNLPSEGLKVRICGHSNPEGPEGGGYDVTVVHTENVKANPFADFAILKLCQHAGGVLPACKVSEEMVALASSDPERESVFFESAFYMPCYFNGHTLSSYDVEGRLGRRSRGDGENFFEVINLDLVKNPRVSFEDGMSGAPVLVVDSKRNRLRVVLIGHQVKTTMHRSVGQVVPVGRMHTLLSGLSSPELLEVKRLIAKRLANFDHSIVTNSPERGRLGAMSKQIQEVTSPEQVCEIIGSLPKIGGTISKRFLKSKVLLLWNDLAVSDSMVFCYLRRKIKNRTHIATAKNLLRRSALRTGAFELVHLRALPSLNEIGQYLTVIQFRRISTESDLSEVRS